MLHAWFRIVYGPGLTRLLRRFVLSVGQGRRRGLGNVADTHLMMVLQRRQCVKRVLI